MITAAGLAPLVRPSAALASDSYAGLRSKWQLFLTGGTGYDASAPEVSAALQFIDSTAGNWLDTLQRSAGRTYLWADHAFEGTPFDQSTDLQRTYERLEQLAIAYSTMGSSFEGDQGLLADLVSAMDWMYDNKYNENQAQYGNWFNWVIGAPLSLNATSMLVFDELGSERIARYMAAIYKNTPAPSMTGANLVWTCMVTAGRGALIDDGTSLAAARDGLSAVFPYVSSGDGFYTDGSFIQHTAHPYTGGYGTPLLAILSRMLYLLDGSPWQVTDPALGNVVDWVYEAFEPWLYKGSMMSGVRGRTISRSVPQDHVAGHDTVRAIMWISQLPSVISSSDAQALQGLVKEVINDDSFLDFYQYQFDSTDAPANEMSSIVKAAQIASDASIPAQAPAVRNKQYPRMDRVAHRRPGFAFAVSMSSARIFTYESINGENLHGWFTGSGMQYLYNDDLGHYDDDYWATVDCYRLPGTTVPVGTRADGSGSNWLSPLHWAGGVALGTLGVTGMDFQIYGGGPTGKKSWFMFDDEIAVLGTDITSSDPRPVESIIENRKLGAGQAQDFLVDGRQQSNSGWTQAFDSVGWAHLDGPVAGTGIGYVFPEATTIAATRELRTGAWSDVNQGGDKTPIQREYLTLWIEHGSEPAGASYAYVLLPGATAAAVQDYASNPAMEIVANRADVQAVRSGGTIGACFWQAGARMVSGLGCDQPAAVLVRQHGYQVSVAVSDPTQQNEAPVHVTIGRSAKTVVTNDQRISVDQLSPSIQLTVDLTGAKGQAAVASFDLN